MPCLFCPDAINYSKVTWTVVNCFTPPPSIKCIVFVRDVIGSGEGVQKLGLCSVLMAVELMFFLAAPAATLGFCGVFFMSSEGVPNLSSRTTSRGPVDLSYRMYPEDHVNRNVLTVRFYKDGQCYHLILSC